MVDQGIHICDETIQKKKDQLRQCIELLERYQWIIDSFVLDFFLDPSLWLQLPEGWRECLNSCSPASLASLLDPDLPALQETVWPQSLLAFKQSIHELTINRHQIQNFDFVRKFLKDNLNTKSGETIAENDVGKFEFYEDMFSVFSGQQSSLKHIFRKHVKPKKQYELARMGKFIRDTTAVVGEKKLIDVGSGVGHLARYLSYAHHLQVACVDSNTDFTEAAKKFDDQLEESVKRLENKISTSKSKFQELNIEENDVSKDCSPAKLHVPSYLAPSDCRPVHVTSYLEPDMNLTDFHKILSEKFLTTDVNLRYGIVGLHTCGDLAPVLIRMFINDSKACMLHSVGCCYMKVKQHFPMSEFVKCIKTQWRFNYTNAELACHAIEMYRDRLRAGEQEKLKVHCYRAVLEKILVTRDSSLRHTILKTVAKAHLLSFKDYALKATSNLSSEFTPEDFLKPEIEEELEAWWKVVVYYTLRLSLAPVLETVILLDRSISLYEAGHNSLLLPLFDPVLSPRNQILFAVKK